MVKQNSHNEFWNFTLESYAVDGVQAAVIGLQDRHSADVNLLFYCCWVAGTGRGRLDADALIRADAELEEWRQNVTLPLRGVRDRIKRQPTLWMMPSASDVRAKVLGAEIESECVAHAILEGCAPHLADVTRPVHQRVGDAASNIRAYFDVLGVSLTDKDRGAVTTLLMAAFPDCADTVVNSTFRA